jgi:hypothetical protein
MATRNPRTAKVYIVTTPSGVKLVRALSSQSAIKHTVLGTHSARLATQDDLLANRTLDVQDATAQGEDL